MTLKTNKLSPRLKSRIQIERLFSAKDTRAVTAYPLRISYREEARHGSDAPVQVLFSVSKRHFKHAVKRNRVKRQIREAYRLNKHLLHEALEQKKDTAVAMAFIWQSDELAETALITEKMQSLLGRMAEKISR